MPRPPIVAVACLTLAVGAVVSGCGSDSKTGDTPPAPAATPPPAAATTRTTATRPSATAAKPSSAGTVEVTMQSSKFVPDTITAKVGQKIKWTNMDGYAHNVTTPDATIRSGNIDGGATYEFTPTKAGTISYVCTIHPNQTGTITVTK